MMIARILFAEFGSLICRVIPSRPTTSPAAGATAQGTDDGETCAIPPAPSPSSPLDYSELFEQHKK